MTTLTAPQADLDALRTPAAAAASTKARCWASRSSASAAETMSNVSTPRSASTAAGSP